MYDTKSTLNRWPMSQCVIFLILPCHENWTENCPLDAWARGFPIVTPCGWTDAFASSIAMFCWTGFWWRANIIYLYQQSELLRCSKFGWQGLFLQQIHSLSEFGYWAAIGLLMNCFSCSNRHCNERSLRMHCNILQEKHVHSKHQQALHLTVLEVNWSSERVGDLIPHEDKWQSKNH